MKCDRDMGWSALRWLSRALQMAIVTKPPLKEQLSESGWSEQNRGRDGEPGPWTGSRAIR